MKTVLVTGSSSGLGKSIIEKYASNGYNTIITYLTHENEALKFNEYIKNKYKVKSICVKLDISEENDIQNLYELILNEFSKIDVLVNNASICNDTLFEDKTKDNFMKIIEVNLIGTFLMSKTFGKLMYNNKNGSIINISSNNGIDSYYSESLDYDASKAGIINLNHNLANVFSPYVRVNTICPGWIETPMNENMSDEFKNKEINKILLKRFASPEEISNLVYFLSSDEASYINDSVIKIDGGKVC